MFGGSNFFTFPSSLFTFCRTFACRNYKQNIMMRKILTCLRVENCCSGSRLTVCISTSPRASAMSLRSSWSRTRTARSPPRSMPTRVTWTTAVPLTGRCLSKSRESGARNICSSISARTRTATTTPTRDITSSR